MQKKISTLTFKVLLLIILFVLPVNILLIFSTKTTTDELYKQVDMSLKNVTDLYVNTLDLGMKNADYYLYNAYTSNPDFITLVETTDELQYLNAKYRCIQSMQQEISSNELCDAYFFYPESKREFVIGNATGTQKEIFQDFLQKSMKVNAKWKIETIAGKQYLVRITKIKDVYYGGFINLERFEKEIKKSINYKSGQVYFSQKESLKKETAQNANVHMVTTTSDKADMNLSIGVENKEINKNLSWWEKRQIIIAVLFLGLLPILYVAIHYWMVIPLKRLNQAHHELEIGNEEFRIRKNGNSTEFQEAYQSFNKMADNIHSLKMENMEKELAKKELQLNNLQLQIRPHFLLNTFNLIFNLAAENKTEDIKELVLYLSAYFRHIFRNGKDMELFPREMKLIEGYIKAAEIRYPGRIKFVAQIDPDIYLMRIPPLLLHNFIENIIKHAMGENRVIHIMLTGEYEDRKIVFNISDDGTGMTEDMVGIINSEAYMDTETEQHVGLKNSAMRLKYFYGEEANIRVESELGKGTVFILTIPYNLEED